MFSLDPFLICLSSLVPLPSCKGLIQLFHRESSFDRIPPSYSTGPPASSLGEKRILVLHSKVLFFSCPRLIDHVNITVRETPNPIYRVCSKLELCSHISQYISKVLVSSVWNALLLETFSRCVLACLTFYFSFLITPRLNSWGHNIFCSQFSVGKFCTNRMLTYIGYMYTHAYFKKSYILESFVKLKELLFWGQRKAT